MLPGRKWFGPTTLYRKPVALMQLNRISVIASFGGRVNKFRVPSGGLRKLSVFWRIQVDDELPRPGTTMLNPASPLIRFAWLGVTGDFRARSRLQ